jgi:hypothetical protein
MARLAALITDVLCVVLCASTWRGSPIPPLLLSGGPDRVKPALVERKQRTGCDLPAHDVVQAHGRPAMGDTTDRGEPVGKRCESVSVAYKNISSLHPSVRRARSHRRRK